MLFQIESHAVDRYIERHAPHLEYQEAFDLLWEHANKRGPVKLKKKTSAGDDVWQLSELGVMIVAKFQNGINVAVTCIPHHEPTGNGLTAEERVQLKEYEERVAAREKQVRAEQAEDEKQISKFDLKTLTKHERARFEEENNSLKTAYRRKLALLVEERTMIRDQLKAIEEQRNHEHRIETRRSEQAVRIRKLEAALKVAVAFLVDRKDQHPEVAGVAMAAIRLINGRFLDRAFYEGIMDVSSDLSDIVD